MKVEQMRCEIAKVYPSTKWEERVKRMPEAQVIAVYHSFLKNDVFNLSQKERTPTNISDAMLDSAVQRAVDREVGYISSRITRDLNTEIRSQVERSVDVTSKDIKDSVSKEITRQVKNIDISDMEREVVNKAKDAVAEKFDRKLDGLLDDFNENLNNVQKIYSSIAKSIAKD